MATFMRETKSHQPSESNTKQDKSYVNDTRPIQSNDSSTRQKRADTRQTPDRNGHYVSIIHHQDNLGLLTQPIEEYESIESLMRHHAKRTDTRNTPDRNDSRNHSKQSFRDQLESGYGCYCQMEKRGPAYDKKYAQPEQLYLDNGDGSLFVVGPALPSDYDQYGVRRGCHHSNSPPASRRLEPTHYNESKKDPSQQDQLTHQQKLHNSVTDSSNQSLPVEGAPTYHA
jgi:hypothetical protein